MLLDDYHVNIEALKGISKLIKIKGFDLNFMVSLDPLKVLKIFESKNKHQSIENIHILITDFNMPILKGNELISKVYFII